MQGIMTKNSNKESNWIFSYKRFKHWVGDILHNYIYLMLNAFNHVQSAFNKILSKYNSKRLRESRPCPSSEAQILPFKAFKSNKVHFTERCLIFQASDKIQFIRSGDQNGTRSSIVERSIRLEMNKTEFSSESGE